MNDQAPRSAPPKKSPQPDSKPSFGESAKQFAKGFAHGVGAESLQIYNDTKEFPSQLAKTGHEILEDIHANRRVRALAPLVAMEHAIRNASRQDVERIAHAAVDAAKEWLEKPAYEKGESLGRATTAIASEVAIDVLTDGMGSIATLRKVGKVAEAADHVRDAEKVVDRAAHKPHLERTGRGKNHLQSEATAVGPHTTFRRNHEGDVTHYVEWKENPRNPSGFDEVKRVDTQHANPHSHRNKETSEEIMTPHAHDASAPGGIRTARTDEQPR